jgi:hypothetical protein
VTWLYDGFLFAVNVAVVVTVVSSQLKREQKATDDPRRKEKKIQTFGWLRCWALSPSSKARKNEESS